MIARTPERQPEPEEDIEKEYIKFLFIDFFSMATRDRILNIINAACLGKSLSPTSMIGNEPLLFIYLNAKANEEGRREEIREKALAIVAEETAKIPGRINIYKNINMGYELP